MKPTRLGACSSRNGGLYSGSRAPGGRSRCAACRRMAGPAHALLCLAHFAGRDHFHGARDLLRVLHALDLGANFFTMAIFLSRLLVLSYRCLVNGVRCARTP